MRLSKEAIIIAILAIGLLGLYSLDRARLGHSIPDEKRYIQSTQEMVETGDYITPWYHGRLRFQKPILFYWLILPSYKIFGVGIFGARFPSIVAGILNVILIYFIGKDLFNKRAGIFSAFVLSTSEIFFVYSRFAVPDMTFLLFIAASVYLFLKAYRNVIKGRFKYLYMYVFMGFAMLTKGPLGFFYPMAIVCLFLLLRRDWPFFKELNLLLGLLVFAVISAPWFVVMILLHGDRYLGKVWSLEIVKKLEYFSFGTKENILIHYSRTGLYYLGMVLARHLPWSAFLPASLVSIRNLGSHREERNYGLTVIWAWFLAVFIFLMLIWSKESYYVLGLSMPVSLFIGNYLSKISEENQLERHLLFRLPFILMVVIYLMAFIIWLGFAIYALDRPVSFFSFLIPIAPFFMIYVLVRRKKTLLPLSLFLMTALCLAYFAGYVIPAVDEESLLKISEEIKEIIQPGDAVGVASNEVSYHRLNVPLKDYIVIRADKRPIYKHPDDEEILKSRRELINEFLSTKHIRIFCVITKKDYYELVDEELRKKLIILDKTQIWKRFDKQGKDYYINLFRYFIEGRRNLVKEALKEEIFLVSNR